MSKRATHVLAVIAAALLAYILIWEQGTLTTGELEARRGQLLEAFVRERVTQLVIERTGEGGDERIVLQRNEPEHEDDFPEWRLHEPVESAVDEDAVDALVGSLEWAAARRVIRDVTDEDRERFGLASPSLSASFTVADQTVSLAFGGEDPQGGGLYFSLDDPTVVYIVGQDLFEELDHDVGHFRSKELYGDLRVERATSLEIVTGEVGARRFERREGRFWITEPIEGLASSHAVRRMLGALAELRASSFVDDADSAGLDEPTREVVIERERDDETQRARVRVGQPCEEDGEHHVRVDVGEDTGTVVCADVSELTTLDVADEDLRERRLVLARDDEVERLEIARGGRTLTVARDEDDWTVTASGSDDSTTADAEAVADFLRELRDARASGFADADDATLRARGLAPPAATLTVHRSGGEAEEQVSLGAVAGEVVWARRGDEPVLLSVPAAVADRFEPTPLGFRSRRLIDDRPHELAALRVGRGGVSEELERGEGTWSLSAPFAAAAESSAVRAVADALASLEAVSFTADRAAASHGLGSPRYVVWGRFESPDDDGHGHGHDEEDELEREHTLRIGAQTEGGAFARLDDDPAVFVVSETVIGAVTEPLIARGLLGTDTDQVDAVVIEREGVRVELSKAGGAWRTAQGAEPDADRTRELIDRIAALRAVGVTYGAATPADGTAAPRARVSIRRSPRSDEPHEYTLRIGAEVVEGDAARVHVRREGTDAGFLVAADGVAVFLTYAP